MIAIHQSFEFIGNCSLLLTRSLRHLGSLPRQSKRLLEHMFQMGYSTLPIVSILSVFIGAVLALQAGFGLKNFGDLQNRVGAIVGLSVARELGPVMTAFLLTGRVGSAITAEIASMTVYQEVDALRTMNIPPERLLVLPRLIAILCMMPLLTLCSIALGFLGGMIVAENVDMIGLEPMIYWRYLLQTVEFSDIQDGLLKAEFFGFFVILICANKGLCARGGPREIGRCVTEAVVASMIFILFADYFITKILI